MTTSGHILQPTPESCVAACTAMLLQQLGHDITPEALMADWEAPISLETPAAPLAALPHTLLYKPLDPLNNRAATLDLYLSRILQRDWCAVTVYPEPMGLLAARLNLATPHGALTRSRIPHHAIILTQLAATIFKALDPYHAGDLQPLDIPRDLFYGQLWTGELLYPQP